MSIEFSCISCNKLLRVPDGSEGKPCQCPSCGAVATVPELPKTTPEAKITPEAKLLAAAAVDDGKISVTCPNCKYPLRCKPELKGTKGQCKQCKHIFVIGDILPNLVEKSALVFSCPKCSQLFDGKAEMEGRKGRCHTCGEVFIIELREATIDRSPSSKAAAKSASTPVVEKPRSSQLKPVAPQSKTAQTSSKRTTEEKNIQLICGSCKGGLEVPASAAGQKTACPHCNQLLQVPDVGNSSSSRTGKSVFDQPSDDIFSGLNVGTTQPQESSGSSASLFDFGGAANSAVDTGSQPYMYPGAYQPGYQQSSYPASNYQSSGYQSPSSSVINSVSPQGNRQWLRSLASWHKQLIWSFLLQLTILGIYLLALMLISLLAAGNEPNKNLALIVGVGVLVYAVVAIALAIWFVISYIVLCLKLYDGGKAAMFIVGYFLGGCVPFLSLILLIVVLINANATLKEHGIQVGFLGADLNSI